MQNKTLLSWLLSNTMSNAHAMQYSFFLGNAVNEQHFKHIFCKHVNNSTYKIAQHFVAFCHGNNEKY